MKKILLAMLCVLCLPFVAADLEYNIANISFCYSLTVELVAAEKNVDANEYYIKGCSVSNTIWSCNCNGSDYKVILGTKPNTINKYMFELNSTTIERKSDTKKTGGHSSFYTGEFVIVKNTVNTNVSMIPAITETPQELTPTVNETEGKAIQQILEQTKPKVNVIEKGNTTQYIAFGIVMLLVICGGIFVYMKMYKGEQQ